MAKKEEMKASINPEDVARAYGAKFNGGVINKRIPSVQTRPKAEYTLDGLIILAYKCEEAAMVEDGLKKTTRKERKMPRQSEAALIEKCKDHFKKGVANGNFTVEEGLNAVQKVDESFLARRQRIMQGEGGKGTSKGTGEVTRTVAGALLTALVLAAALLPNVIGKESQRSEPFNQYPVTPTVVDSGSLNQEQAAEKKLIQIGDRTFEDRLVRDRQAHEDARQDAVREDWEDKHGPSRGN